MQNRAKVNICNTTLVGLRGLEITELEVLRNHDLTTMDIRCFFWIQQKTSLPPLFDNFMRQVNVVTITIRNSFFSQAGRHSTQSSWKRPVRFVRFPSTSWSETFFPWLVSYWVHILSNFDFRQDFMIDLGVGSGLKSQQDSLGCVSASLKQPKVVTFMNFLRDSKFV